VYKGERAAVLVHNGVCHLDPWTYASASGIKVRGVNTVSAYCAPNEEIEEYLSDLTAQLLKR
jgi:hypothetical protein